jgi:lysophospholipase L1-like esterase
MSIFTCLTWVTLLTCAAALSPQVTLGQSLSIIRKGETNYWVEASAPANDPHVLQATENLDLWVNTRSEVQQSYSFQLDSAAAARRYFRLIPAPAPPPPIRVLILGDSMASDCCGWGSGMYGYFNENATVVNYATAWASTKIFLQSAELDKMLLIKPDYVLLQYGFMDGGTDPDRSTEPEEFAENLRKIVQLVRDFNGVPVLITLHAARLFDSEGKVIPSWATQTAVVRQVATELDTPLIDLHQLTIDLLNELGPTGAAFMQSPAFGPTDLMHLSPLGAQYVARLVVNALPGPLGPYLTGIFEPPPKP